MAAELDFVNFGHFYIEVIFSAELRLNKARGNIWSRPQACRATNLNLGSSHRVALNEY